MSLLFETIKVVGRTPMNLDLHNERVNRSRRLLLRTEEPLDLRTHILVPSSLGMDVYRCRIAYEVSVESVEFLPYRPPEIKTVQLVRADHVRYEYKFTDREAINNLVRNSSADEILMVVGGELTDLSIANIVFFDGTRWVTPSKPLLPGTKRQLLVTKGALFEERLTPDDLRRFSKAAPINAMLDIGEVPSIETKKISW